MYKATHKTTNATHLVDEARKEALERVTRSYFFEEIPEPKEANKAAPKKEEEPQAGKKKSEEPEDNLNK